ncbi:hypothetical protein [Streptomyces caniscabiei]|uniref:hypothetical protein n=1 Tax=Streptomyces caniscabiei TaxID=2746961 RepID=UPI001872DAD3|nr:hypothetical protein [Streptomyces caniscabiei]MBE4735727.1 hypothetical protein [Streptomyces caniscabiei]MBE4758340.1 hypothetical protein [Streptomyces caniscabiei]
MRSWKTFVDATDPDGRTGTLETPVCADTETQAAVAAIQGAQAAGYTPVDGRVHLEDDGNCTHS